MNAASVQPIEVVTVTAGQVAGAFAVWLMLIGLAVAGGVWAIWPHRRQDTNGAGATEKRTRPARRSRRRPPYTGVVHDCPADTTLELPAVDGDR